MFASVKIWDCHGNLLRVGLAVCMPLTEVWTSTSLTGRCGRIVTLSDENRGISGVRSQDEHSNKSRTTLCRLGLSCAVWVCPVPFGFRQAALGFRRSPRGSDIRNDWPAEVIRASFLPSQARATHYISAVSGGCRPSAAVIGTHQNPCLVGPRNTALALVRISRDHRR